MGSGVLMVLAAITGYLAGSISFARLIVRAHGHQRVAPVDLVSPDGRATLVSDAVSATAVRLQLGPKWGILCGVLDIAKATIPVLAFRIAFPGEPYLYAVGLFAIVGHNWPLYHGFKGGRGQSPMLGAMLGIAPLGAVVCTAVGFVVGYWVIKDAMASDNLGQVLYIPWVWIAGLGPWAIAWAVLSNVVFFGSYYGEIAQYARGKRSGSLKDPDDVMRMMRMDYDWIVSEKQPASDEPGPAPPDDRV